MAKNRSTLNVLHDYFRQGQIKKTYLALTQGQWQKRECLVEAPLLKNQLRSGERMVHVSRDGKKSITQFYPIAVYPTASLVQVALKTGRTHQIRVHSQYRKHPIAGDEKYGDKAFNQQMKQFGLKRLFLHAKQLEFILPGQTERLRIKAELDPALQAVINQLEKA